MKTRYHGAVVLMSLAGMLAGCDAMQALGLQKPTAQLKGLRFDKVSLEAATLVFDVEVDNPYPVALPLTNMDYGLTSNAKPLLSGKADAAGSIPARSSQTLSLPVSVSYLDLFNAFKGIKPGVSIPYKAEMGLSMDTPALGNLRLPLQKAGELAVPSIPDLNSIDWKSKILDTIKKQ